MEVAVVLSEKLARVLTRVDHLLGWLGSRNIHEWFTE